MFKFVLDENITIVDDLLPKNVLNARELYFQKGVRQFGIKDGHLLKIANKENFIIITKDSGLVIKANNINTNIVYVVGKYGKHWYLIPGKEKLGNRRKLQAYIDKENPLINL